LFVTHEFAKRRRFVFPGTPGRRARLRRRARTRPTHLLGHGSARERGRRLFSVRASVSRLCWGEGGGGISGVSDAKEREVTVEPKKGSRGGGRAFGGFESEEGREEDDRGFWWEGGPHFWRLAKKRLDSNFAHGPANEWRRPATKQAPIRARIGPARQIGPARAAASGGPPLWRRVRISMGRRHGGSVGAPLQPGRHKEQHSQLQQRPFAERMKEDRDVLGDGRTNIDQTGRPKNAGGAS
jgi:hypothetical protein